MIENTDNSNIENEDVDLVMLVDAIRSSSNAELAVLSNISTTIAEVKELLSKSGELDKKLHKMADKEHRVWRRTNRQNVTPKQNKPTSDKRAKPPAKPTNKRPGEAELVISRPSQVKPPSLPEVPESIARPADIEQRDIKTVADSVEQMEASTTKAMNELSKYWRDEKGRLRRPSGQYASKAEKEAYEKNAQETAQEREEEKRNSALTTILTKGKDVIGKTSETDAAEAGGAAAGGTYFYAVKETVDLLNSTKEKIDELKGDDENGEKAWLGSLFQKLLKKEDAQPTKTEKAKEESSQRQQRELLQEQNAQQIRDADTTHRKLDDVVSAIRASGEESLLDSVMDMTSFMDDAMDISRSRGGRGKGKGGKSQRTKNNRGSIRRGPRGLRGPQSILEKFRNTTAKGAKGTKQMGKGFWQFSKDKFSHAKSFLKSGASKGTDLLKSVSPKSILKVGGPLAAVVGGLDKFLSVKDDDSLSTEQKTAQVASTAAGGGLGTTIGAAIGATLGSIVPGLGTAAGGFVGGAIGGGVGTLIGSDIGETISDFIGSDSSLTEYVSNAWDSATEGASEMLDFASEGAEKALDHVSDVFDDVSDVLKDTKSSIASWFSGGGSEGNESQTINHAAGETTTPMASTTPVVGYPVVNLEQSASITESEKKELFKESISEKPLTVSLDEKSLQALQNAGVNAAVQTSNPNVTVKTAEAKGTRNIPDDFTTRELRRQSADMD